MRPLPELDVKSRKGTLAGCPWCKVRSFGQNHRHTHYGSPVYFLALRRLPQFLLLPCQFQLCLSSENITRNGGRPQNSPSGYFPQALKTRPSCSPPLPQ